MTFAYYWDRELFEALLRYRMRPFLAQILLTYEGKMATTADIQKLVENMKRAQALTSRAASDAPKNTAIMDRFEQRMNLMNEQFGKIDEYEKQLAAMDAMGNGGPPLDETFSSSSPSIVPSQQPVHVAIHPDTGDPVK